MTEIEYEPDVEPASSGSAGPDEVLAGGFPAHHLHVGFQGVLIGVPTLEQEE